MSSTGDPTPFDVMVFGFLGCLVGSIVTGILAWHMAHGNMERRAVEAGVGRYYINQETFKREFTFTPPTNK